jgi:hypothetical protein
MTTLLLFPLLPSLCTLCAAHFLFLSKRGLALGLKVWKKGAVPYSIYCFLGIKDVAVRSRGNSAAKGRPALFIFWPLTGRARPRYGTCRGNK